MVARHFMGRVMEEEYDIRCPESHQFHRLSPHRMTGDYALGSRLSEALANDELEVHYQPQFDAASGRGCGVEALARWTMDGEAISPADFIPVAERFGSICAVGSWVLQHACRTVARWVDTALPVITLSVNVSAHQINDEFTSTIARILEATGFEGRRLELEITESALITNIECVIDCLEQWRRQGVRIAIDDFGTGYSSLQYLSRLPLDRLKLDRAFVHRMLLDRKSAAVVRSIFSLGNDIGVTVLAEGIESERQFEFLQGLGCQQVQGFLFAKPMTEHLARALLAEPWGARKQPTLCLERLQSRTLYAA
jgi:EAL domain-containing protein (putative c-di-GMP-specific phosphodiesterase class I)